MDWRQKGMWRHVSERIRKRIKANIVNEASTRLVIYITVLALLDFGFFLNLEHYNDLGVLTIVIMAVFFTFFIICLLAVFYNYFITIRENSRLVDEATFMCVGTVVSKVTDTSRYELMVKVPEEKIAFKIMSMPSFHRRAEAGKRVLVLTASKKLESRMFGVEPSEYDKDGIL